MAIFRGILGIIIGVGAAYLAGILLDYFNVYKGADYTRVYPFLTSLGGAVGAFIAMLIRGTVGNSRVVVERAAKVKAKDDAMSRLAESMSAGNPASRNSSPGSSPSSNLGSTGNAGSGGGSVSILGSSPSASSPTTSAGSSGRVNFGESKDVPGMPSFEVKNTPPGEGGSRPKVQQ